MQNLFRRPSGIYVLRIAVPIALRPIFDKREVIESTGTRDLTIAKMIAGAQAAQWRQRFFDAGRLMSLASTCMTDHHEILRIAQGSPMLLIGGYLTIPQASAASGLSEHVMLGAAADGKLSLFYRAGSIRGHLLRGNTLDLDDPEMGRAGGLVIPSAKDMPEGALAHMGTGLLRIPLMDLPGVCQALLASSAAFLLHAFDLPDRPGMLFLPNDSVSVCLDNVEVAAGEIESLRKSVVATIDPKRLREAKARHKATSIGVAALAGKKAHERLSSALADYIRDRVRHAVGVESEVTRIRNGCNLLIELEGDLTLAEIDTERLRRFRDQKLSKVPANENKIRLKYGTETVAQSMNAVEGTPWAVMTVAERDKRMRWICAWFAWLKEDGRIGIDPSLILRSESVLTKAQRRKLKTTRRDDEARDVFTTDDLAVIFSAAWFKAGKGELTKQGTYRTYSPMRYWLPLLGLFTGGGRINELCQLHLDDVGKTVDGVWYVEINEDADDQKLKSKPSRRKVPLHPVFLTLGFDKWHAALAEAGYTRLFPELKRDKDKGYGKAASKWFSSYMASHGIPRDGRKAFHSFRHTYTNALPEDTPERIRRQLTGHERGKDVHDATYRKDVSPAIAAPYVNRLAVRLPEIAPFDIAAGLTSISDALARKNRGLGADEDLGKTSTGRPI